MADDRKKAAKSETLTIRLDQKTRFMLEFMARLRGQSLTTVVERAIVDAANNATIEIPSYQNQITKSWTDFWDVEEGVRLLKIAEQQQLYPTYEEEVILDFAKAHWQFFYSSPDCRYPRRGYIRALWPKLSEFLEIWKKTKATDYFSAGMAMKAALQQGGIAPPEWPLKAEPKDDGPPQSHIPIDDDDEEIPF